ncbi:response regulator receiver protein [Methylocucumis oryzae]|uniref:Response regulator receiver protein n=2 Tax=Methylocucumis oryzae TaxID=1632867 RepID=A0A0F3IIX2_9GAMM|nr:response regulator receiver protein [Methylocucumis oryzae]
MVKLMIVDDSTIVQRRIERDLQLPYVKVVGSASDGVEAVQLFQQTLPDAVTLDLTMPNMDGLATVSALLAIQPKTRILVISALADKATAIEAIRRGANGFIYKPFTETELNAALRELLGD